MKFNPVLILGLLFALIAPVFAADVSVHISPSHPDNEDIVTITAEYEIVVPVYMIRIYVNGDQVKGCENPTCSFTGGPYEELEYYIRYFDENGDTQQMQSVDVIEAPKDSDDDDIFDFMDNCIWDKNHAQEDEDEDGIGDACDNCKEIPNENQWDYDNDKYGDICDTCEEIYDPEQKNSDLDALGDLCDNCPYSTNPEQEDYDDDGVGNECDNCEWDENPEQNDSDFAKNCIQNTEGQSACPPMSDEFGDSCDNCPNVFNLFQEDADLDMVGDFCDNCPNFPNTPQGDIDNDGIGDACDCDDKFKGAHANILHRKPFQ
jgi:hypothetical protein